MPAIAPVAKIPIPIGNPKLEEPFSSDSVSDVLSVELEVLGPLFLFSFSDSFVFLVSCFVVSFLSESYPVDCVFSLRCDFVAVTTPVCAARFVSRYA